MVAQGHPTNCVCSDGGVDFAATQSGIEPPGSTDAVGQKGAPHSTQGPHSSLGEEPTFVWDSDNLPDLYLCPTTAVGQQGKSTNFLFP